MQWWNKSARGRSRTDTESLVTMPATQPEKASWGYSGATPTPEVTPEPYRELFDTVLTRQEITTIQRGTEKALGIGQAEFLLKVAKLRG